MSFDKWMVGILSWRAKRGKEALQLVVTSVAHPESVVRSAEGRQQREVGVLDLSNRWRVHSAVGRHATGQKTVEGRGASGIERTEHGDAPEGQAIEAVGAMRAARVRCQFAEGVGPTPDDDDVA